MPDRSDLVKVLDRVERAGWILRTRDTVDRHRHVLVLTDEARAAIDKTERVSRAITDDVPAGLSEPERRTLHRSLLKAFGKPGD
ncbi:MarR family winged helix-turn-helix transcriptional regulator [Kibdelosporangium phytohabitans]|uniref:HTH marR-type domain-containing protein n=1 Tax=Kibdelosporangium phytohabitans TaxID=860235 RepID=A0A0N9I4X1_9PSEU|nr:MarR family winged helix-turn-helix transcriptional regulator [Kibdelosporangium phytohabitans]ALG09882.1 hypothetical protein AOZ06_25955 [Kibdelosporangium phytohabitans]MBE1468717.1 DNA-binding MarR family transcriptional regulator [Kibdelosporangium phytohabitans]